ncbi:MAG: glutathione S-transferase [Sandaracinus sp.]|nr:glutathione S-transferase [Myxococcales bacterium]MCB9603221.1 glutathione S-transferase [Sandaracinus sp.]MCB9612651.1 glutathione S-transferase [Sandaracinus sp.]MCB9619991.1 glutathione S-transferase [Sandaracinus sp.]MCB9623013.1 glutathione S-transferase [Sandaracinus sp.]
MPKITVHHLERSRSHRVLWLLEELGLPYEVVRYERDPETMRAPEALRKIHPLGKSPVVDVDGVVLAESGAILEELVDLAGGKLRPEAGSEAHRRYRFFLHYAEGSLMPPLLVHLITGQLRTKKIPFLVRPIAKAIAGQIDGAFTNGELASNVAFLEKELASRSFLAGDELSAADVQMSYPVLALLSRSGAPAPAIRAYVARLEARPAYAKAIEVGGPIDLDG